MRRAIEIQGNEEEVTGLTDETVKDTAVCEIQERERDGGRDSRAKSSAKGTQRDDKLPE
jgi:hypothetical protein